ncbi:Exosome complex component RRP4 [Dictyocoela muelleri]|nr:Exosome complex component RRP4 [Dictyocoela muelleri]
MKMHIPGDEIVDNSNYLQGYGTYTFQGKLISSLLGTPNLINKLYFVNPYKKYRFYGNIGDVIIGRIVGIGHKRWDIEMNSIYKCSLNLTAINLPGPVQRRKLESDQLNMKKFFDKNDLVVAEIQKISKSGTCSLHTRNDKYRKLENGFLVEIPPFLIGRYRSHFIEINEFVVIIGKNGFIWIGTNSADDRKDDILIFDVYEYLISCRDKCKNVDDSVIYNILSGKK